MNKKNGDIIELDTNKFVKHLLIVIVILLVFVVLFSSIRKVDAGNKGVLLTMGKADLDVKQEGIILKFPFVQKLVEIEVRTKKVEVETDSSSKDLQNVKTLIALNYHVLPNEVVNMYNNIGLEYESRIIQPAIEESVKSVSAKFTAEELVTKRSEVRLKIKEELDNRLKKYYLHVDDFNIVNFQFSEEFDKAIEQKVTAEQLKLKANMDLERIKIEKEQKITQAEAEAKALELQRLQVTTDLIDLRRIENQKLAIDKWNGVLPYVTGGSIPLIDLESLNVNSTN